jgi:hypothetical protein
LAIRPTGRKIHSSMGGAASTWARVCADLAEWRLSWKAALAVSIEEVRWHSAASCESLPFWWASILVKNSTIFCSRFLARSSIRSIASGSKSLAGIHSERLATTPKFTHKSLHCSFCVSFLYLVLREVVITTHRPGIPPGCTPRLSTAPARDRMPQFARWSPCLHGSRKRLSHGPSAGQRGASGHGPMLHDVLIMFGMCKRPKTIENEEGLEIIPFSAILPRFDADSATDASGNCHRPGKSQKGQAGRRFGHRGCVDHRAVSRGIK